MLKITVALAALNDSAFGKTILGQKYHIFERKLETASKKTRKQKQKQKNYHRIKRFTQISVSDPKESLGDLHGRVAGCKPQVV